MKNETFRLIRLHAKKSQREFAAYIGVSNGTVAHIESGQKEVTPYVKAKLADKFDLTDDFFIFIEKYRKLSQ